MTKKTKFATALLATAPLSNGFTLETKEEVTTVELETATEVIAEKEINSVTEPQHLVAEEEIQVKILEGEPAIKEDETLPIVPTETEPPLTLEPQQATTIPQKQADTEQLVHQPEQVTVTREPTINILEPDSMNGIDFGTSQTIQPDIPSELVYTEEQLTDPTQTPDGTPVEQAELSDEIFIPEGATVIYHYPTEEEMSKEFYVPGFGWVKSSGEPSIRIQALDLYGSGCQSWNHGWVSK